MYTCPIKQKMWNFLEEKTLGKWKLRLRSWKRKDQRDTGQIKSPTEEGQ
jgi:hypothetical protein